MKERGRIRPIKMAKDISTAFAAQFGLSKSRSLQIARASCVGNMLIGIGKLLMGILSFSFFTCVSAFYTFGTVVAKSCALAGLIQDNDRNTQYRYYRLSGIVLIAASVLYIIYSMKKVVLTIGIIIALVLAALLMWKVVFPFLGWALGGIFGAIELSFDGIISAVKSVLN